MTFSIALNTVISSFVLIVGLFLFQYAEKKVRQAYFPITDPNLSKAFYASHSTLAWEKLEYLHHLTLRPDCQNHTFRKYGC